MPDRKPLRFDAEDPSSKPARLPRRRGAGAKQRVIVKAKTPGYVPPGFTVRTRIDEVMFTADAPADAVTAAEADPDVESVALAKRLDLTD